MAAEEKKTLSKVLKKREKEEYSQVMELIEELQDIENDENAERWIEPYIQRMYTYVQTFLPINVVELLSSYSHSSFIPLLRNRILSHPTEWTALPMHTKYTLMDYLLSKNANDVPLSFIKTMYKLGFDKASKTIISPRSDVVLWQIKHCYLDPAEIDVFHYKVSPLSRAVFNIINRGQGIPHPEKVVMYLLVMGADPYLQDDYGVTPLQHALHGCIRLRRDHMPASMIKSLHRAIHAFLLSSRENLLELEHYAPGNNNNNSIMVRTAMDMLEKEREADPVFDRTFDPMQEEVRIRMREIADKITPYVKACRRIYNNQGHVVGYEKNHLQEDDEKKDEGPVARGGMRKKHRTHKKRNASRLKRTLALTRVHH